MNRAMEEIIRTPACEALAESWASMDGWSREFEKGRDDPEYDNVEGRYEAYCTEAAEMIRRLRERGFDVTLIPKGAGDA